MMNDKSDGWTGGRKLGKGKNGNGKPKTALMVGLLVVAVLLLAVLVFRQIDRLNGSRKEGWVATGPLNAGTELTAEHFKRVVAGVDRFPEGAVEDLDRLLGRRLSRGKQPGQLFVDTDFNGGGNGSPDERAQKLAELLPPGRVLTPVRVQVASIIMNELAFGDRFEIVASSRARTDEKSTSVVASDAYFVAWIDPSLLAAGGGAPAPERGGLLSGLSTIPGRAPGGGGSGSGTRMLLALFPRDVLPVTEAQADGATLNLVLHGRREVEQGQLLELPASEPWEVEVFAGDERETVDFVR